MSIKKYQGVTPSMILVSSYYGEHDSFKMVPTSEDCPYVECIYDPSIQFLVVIGKNKKNGFHMTEKLDANGHPVPVKNFNPQKHRHPHVKERKTVETWQEYYIIKEDEQKNFIESFAMNAKDFDYKKLMVKPELPEEGSAVIGGNHAGKLVDEHGNLINKDSKSKK